VSRSPAGAEYFKLINSLEEDRLARAAFHQLALRLAPAGGTLFDFGAGPGIDARFFAERGLTVEAYDVDPRMREFFLEHCTDFIKAGRVALDCSTYQEFVDRRDTLMGRKVDLVVSDFAPLNQVSEPRELFAKLHAITLPGARLLASVLNPCFRGDWKLRWWWRSLLPLLRTGSFFMPGPQAPHFRRLPSNFNSLSSPYFKLTRIHRGLPPAGSCPPDGIDAGRALGHSWLHLTASRFLFLQFERCD
jgi:SAM-dependent methyltransferase